jgi:hypothetical protein
MNRGRIVTMAIPLMIGIGPFLSASAAESDYDASAYAYGNVPYGSLDFDYWGDGRDWRRGRDHDDGFHGGGDHGHGGSRR